MVVANRSNHYGIAGYYSMQALKDHLIVNLKPSTKKNPGGFPGFRLPS